jgi:hypothetical protein
MSRTLYSPRLSDDLIRLLYQEGKRRHMPMTRLADDLIRSALSANPDTGSQRPEPVGEPGIVAFPGAA